MNGLPEITSENHSICDAYASWYADNNCDPAGDAYESSQCQVFSYESEQIKGDDLQRINQICKNIEQGTSGQIKSSQPSDNISSYYSWSSLIKDSWPLFLVLGTAWKISYALRLIDKTREEYKASQERGENKSVLEILHQVRKSEIKNILDHLFIWRWNIFRRFFVQKGMAINGIGNSSPAGNGSNDTDNSFPILNRPSSPSPQDKLSSSDSSAITYQINYPMMGGMIVFRKGQSNLAPKSSIMKSYMPLFYRPPVTTRPAI